MSQTAQQSTKVLSSTNSGLFTHSSSSNLTPTNSSQQSHTSWLLRFFESKHFDMSIAISYLFNTKEPGTQSYLCNRLFTFTNNDVDFYLPQLLNIYIYSCNDNEQLMAEMLNTYFRSRCSCKSSGIDFSLKCSWLLDAYINDNAKLLATTSKESRIRRGLNNAIKLYKMIISERLRPVSVASENNFSNNGRSVHLEPNYNLKKTRSIPHEHNSEINLDLNKITNGVNSNANNVANSNSNYSINGPLKEESLHDIVSETKSIEKNLTVPKIINTDM